MPILTSGKNKNLLFIHIPKTAGTTIKSYLRHETQMTVNDEFGVDLPCPPQHFHAELIERLGLDRLCSESVAIVRHPIDRFLSEYAYRKIVDRKFQFLSLTVFVIFCEQTLTSNRYVLSNHIRPQHQFILPDTIVYKLENGLSPFYKAFSDYFDADSNKEKVIRNKSGSKKLQIDKRDLQRLLKLYEKDFETLEYEEFGAYQVKNIHTLEYALHCCLGNLMAVIYKLRMKLRK